MLARLPAIQLAETRNLAGPDEYESLLESVSDEEITVVKWTADYCRTCRAATPKIRGMFKRFFAQYPQASFYSMELTKDNNEMHAYFESRNVTRMPFVEVYVGQQLADSLVVPPSRVAFLGNALQAARRVASSRVQARRARRERRRLVLLAQSQRRSKRRIQQERAQLVQEWKRTTSDSGGLAQRALRKRYLMKLRTLRQAAVRLDADTTRLNRRRQLFMLLVMRQ